MKHSYLHDVLPFLRELEREKQKQFEAYFRTAPLWLMDLFQSEIMEAGTTFIRENEPADTIFFVARGRVKATDYRISGIAYESHCAWWYGGDPGTGYLPDHPADRDRVYCYQASKSAV